MENQIQNKPHMTPKDFFLHLGVAISLYVNVVAFLMLVFRIIDVLLPVDGLDSYVYNTSISGPVATLIVVIPVFLVLSWLLNRGYQVEPQKRELGFRKWLIYITLFVSGIVVASDLITVIYIFLNGNNITLGFILKALVVLITALGVFGYYIFDLRGKTAGKINKIAFWKTIIIPLIFIILGFWVVGSPATQRNRQIDQQKINDLQNIQWQVISFWQSKGRLPADVNELNDPLIGFIVPTDSQSGKVYTYQKVSNLEFKICADFNLASVDSDLESKPIYPGQIDANWQHPAGETCFNRTVDPERFPVQKR